MTLQEILDQISMKYPHAFTNTVVIGMINDIQKRLFRTIYKPITATTYDLIEDNAFYPIDYSPETITDVVVDGKEYPLQNIELNSVGCFYYITEDNTIGLYPTPTEDVTSGLTVFRYKEPTVLTTSSLSLEPDFDKAWHMMIVCAVCKELAGFAQDAGMVNSFTMEYNGLERDYKRSTPDRFEPIQDVYGGCYE